MNTIELDGVTYTAAKISGMRQFHIVRRMLPLLAGMSPSQAREAGAAMLSGLAEALGKLPDADAEYILLGLLGGVRKQEPGGIGHSPVAVDGKLMYQNLGLVDMMKLAVLSFKFNMSDFSAALPQVLTSASPKPNSP